MKKCVPLIALLAFGVLATQAEASSFYLDDGLNLPAQLICNDGTCTVGMPPPLQPPLLVGRVITIGGTTITYPASDTATVGADGSVTITDGTKP